MTNALARCVFEIRRFFSAPGYLVGNMSSTSFGSPFVRTSTSMAKSGAVREEEGDLFQAPRTTSLAHCVSSDLKMGAGIAVLFRKQFGRVDDLKRQKKGVGEVAYLIDGPRYIFYLVTKQWFYNKPTEWTLRQSLDEMKDLCQNFQVQKLAMPRIGCGLDGLKWPVVFRMVQEVFSGSGIDVTIYSIPDKRTTPSLTRTQERFSKFFDCSKPQSAPSDMTSKRKLHTGSMYESDTPKKRGRTMYGIPETDDVANRCPDDARSSRKFRGPPNHSPSPEDKSVGESIRKSLVPSSHVPSVTFPPFQRTRNKEEIPFLSDFVKETVNSCREDISASPKLEIDCAKLPLTSVPSKRKRAGDEVSAGRDTPSSPTLKRVKSEDPMHSSSSLSEHKVSSSAGISENWAIRRPVVQVVGKKYSLALYENETLKTSDDLREKGNMSSEYSSEEDDAVKSKTKSRKKKAKKSQDGKKSWDLDPYPAGHKPDYDGKHRETDSSPEDKKRDHRRKSRDSKHKDKRKSQSSSRKHKKKSRSSSRSKDGKERKSRGRHKKDRKKSRDSSSSSSEGKSRGRSGSNEKLSRYSMKASHKKSSKVDRSYEEEAVKSHRTPRKNLRKSDSPDISLGNEWGIEKKTTPARGAVQLKYRTDTEDSDESPQGIQARLGYVRGRFLKDEEDEVIKPIKAHTMSGYSKTDDVSSKLTATATMYSDREEKRTSAKARLALKGKP